MSGVLVAPPVSAHALAHLNDLDRMIAELDQPGARATLKRLGLELPGLARLRAQRDKLAQVAEPRWQTLYERLRARYARPIAAVRAQVCTGCFVTLPPSARGRTSGEDAPICPGCGRLLLWI